MSYLWEAFIDSYEEVEVTNSDESLRVTFEYIGEGQSGDYNPEDAFDVPLLRFYVAKWVQHEPHYGEWEDLDDCSYCTRIPVNTSRDDVEKLATFVLSEVEKATSPKKRCEELSWMDQTWAVKV